MKIDFFKVHLILSFVTIFFYYSLALGGFNFFDAVNFLSLDFESAIYKYCSAVIALGIGSFIVKYIQNINYKVNTVLPKEHHKKGNQEFYVLGWVSCLFLMLLVGITYSDDLLLRYNYQLINEAGAGLWLSLAETAIGFGPMFCRIYSPNNFISTISRRILLTISVVFLYSIATKYSVACLLFYISASFYRNSKLNYGCYLGLAFSMPLLSLILNQRSNGIYGLSSIETTLTNLYNDPLSVVGFGVEVIVSPIFILSETFHRANLSLSDFLTEVNPLPGKYTDWYSIYYYHRVNPNIPFSALGTLYYYSWFSLIIFGALLQYVTNLIGIMVKFISVNFSGTITAVFSIYFWAMINAYNLRSIMRWVYLILFLYLIFKLVTKKSNFRRTVVK